MELITFVILLLYPDKFTFLDTIPPTAASPRRQLFYAPRDNLVDAHGSFPTLHSVQKDRNGGKAKNGAYRLEMQMLVIDEFDVANIVLKITGIYHGLSADGRLDPSRKLL